MAKHQTAKNKFGMMTRGQNTMSSSPKECDVIVIGAGYGGVISAAILARNGLRTVIVDPCDQVGGKTGAVNRNGYWLDMGLKDARDTADFLMVMSLPELYGQQAARAAGAEVAMVAVGQMRCHVYPSGEIADMNMQSEQAIAAYLMQATGVPADRIAEFGALLASLAALDPLKYRKVILKDWLEENIADGEMHTYLYRYLLQLFARPPEKASVGRIAEMFHSSGLTFRANDPEAGGMQGFIEPYARVVRKHDGKIMLGQTPFEILVKDGKVQGVVIADKSGAIQELHAPVVIFSWAVWHILELLDENLLPDDLVTNARTLEHKYNLDTLAVHMGLSQVPTVRATGKPDDWDGSQRVVVGADRDYGGIWLLSSLATPRVAPPGKHLITFLYCSGGEIDDKHPPFKSYSQAKEEILATTIACARDYYSDLDEITEWTSFNYHKQGGVLGWGFSSVERAPVRCPTIKGLYFVGSSTEVSGLVQDHDAHSALVATDMILNACRASSAA